MKKVLAIVTGIVLISGSAFCWEAGWEQAKRFNYLKVGGGYGQTGCDIDGDGGIQTDNGVTADSVEIGGGYGDTGISLTREGDVSLNGDLVVDGTTTISLAQNLEAALTVDVDADEALLIRQNGDAGDILIVDTNNSIVNIPDDVLLACGDSDDSSFAFNTAQTVDSLFLTLATASRHLTICEAGDQSTNFAHTQSTNPTLFIQSSDQATVADWLAFTHNQTNGVITTGAGDITFDPNGGVVTLSGITDSFKSNILQTVSAGALSVEGNVADGGGVAGVQIGNETSLTTAGDKILSLYPDGLTTEVAYFDYLGGLIIAQGAGTGTPIAFSVTGGAHTALTAATEVTGVTFDFSANKTWASGAGPLATQREIEFLRPTYIGDAGGALTITDAATVYIDNAPAAGANMTLTNAYAMWVDDGSCRFDGNVLVDGTIDTVTATALNVGTATQTALTLGRSGVNTTIDSVLILNNSTVSWSASASAPSVSQGTRSGDQATSNMTLVAQTAYQDASDTTNDDGGTLVLQGGDANLLETVGGDGGNVVLQPGNNDTGGNGDDGSVYVYCPGKTIGSDPDYIESYHDDTNAYITTGVGDLNISAVAGSGVSINNLLAGKIDMPDDSYSISMDVPSTTTASSGDDVGYSFAVDGFPVFDVIADADGDGSVTDDGVQLHGAFWAAPVTYSMAAGTAITTDSVSIRVYGSGAATTLTGTPTLEAGARDGQIVMIIGTNDTNTVTLQDESNLANSDLQLSGGIDFTLGLGDTIQLYYDLTDTEWYELSRSDN